MSSEFLASKPLMVFDVESVGLHGEGFAVGWVVVTAEGEQAAEGIVGCDPELAHGTDAGLAWVRENVPPLDTSRENPEEVRRYFWELWLEWAKLDAVLVADVPWPVEARFLATCVDEGFPESEWKGPYPLIDVASVRLARGFDPLARDETSVHSPLADAKQSARLLLEVVAGKDGTPDEQ